MRLLGIVLIVLGLAALAAGGVSYTRRREAARVGPLSVSVRERRTFPVPPLLGGVALLAGAALLVAAGRRRGG